MKPYITDLEEFCKVGALYGFKIEGHQFVATFYHPEGDIKIYIALTGDIYFKHIYKTTTGTEIEVFLNLDKDDVLSLYPLKEIAYLIKFKEDKKKQIG